ncbi:MAG TPA: hypothetical protein VF132_01445, partial [Rudaea sp.]
NEVYVDRPDGKGRYRLDSYDPALGEIVSRKNTQLGEIKPETALNYLRELVKKYSPGTRISDVPSNRASGLAGQELQGRMILEVPRQETPVPSSICDEAKCRGVTIRDIEGTEH